MPHEVCSFLHRPRFSAHTTALFVELLNHRPPTIFDDPSLRREQWSNFAGEGATRSVQNRTRVSLSFRVDLPVLSPWAGLPEAIERLS